MTVNLPYGFPYPASTEPVANGASNIEDLARAVNDKMGLFKIANGTFSGITTGAPLDVNGVFSSLYTNYVLHLRSATTSGATASVNVRMRTALAQEAGSVYNFAHAGSWVNSGPVFQFGQFSVTNPFTPETSFWTGINAGLTYSGSSRIDIFSPNVARQTRFMSQSWVDYDGARYNVAMSATGEVGTNTQYTGFRLFPQAGTISGEYILYGYRN
jgi:hypothetical protein